MQWTIKWFDYKTGRSLQDVHITEAGFIAAARGMLRNPSMRFESAVLPNGTLVKDEGALRALVAASTVGR